MKMFSPHRQFGLQGHFSCHLVIRLRSFPRRWRRRRSNLYGQADWGSNFTPSNPHPHCECFHLGFLSSWTYCNLDSSIIYSSTVLFRTGNKALWWWSPVATWCWHKVVVDVSYDWTCSLLQTRKFNWCQYKCIAYIVYSLLLNFFRCPILKTFEGITWLEMTGRLFKHSMIYSLCVSRKFRWYFLNINIKSNLADSSCISAASISRENTHCLRGCPFFFRNHWGLEGTSRPVSGNLQHRSSGYWQTRRLFRSNISDTSIYGCNVYVLIYSHLSHLTDYLSVEPNN